MKANISTQYEMTLSFIMRNIIPHRSKTDNGQQICRRKFALEYEEIDSGKPSSQTSVRIQTYAIHTPNVSNSRLVI